jgi:nucleotide-binding universal stress UspA family protein
MRTALPPAGAAGAVGTPAEARPPTAPDGRPESGVSIRDLLFPTDLSPYSERAFEQARFLADTFRARLTLYHAVEVPDPAYPHWRFEGARQIWDHLEHSAREQLARKAASLTAEHAVEVERATSVETALLSFIRRSRPDLIVMATHGREGLKHFLLGSLTESVYRHSFRPVLCVREPEHGAAPPYRRILVPTDLSLASRLAFPLAALLARGFGAEVIAAHVISTTAARGSEVTPTEAWLYKFVERDFAGLELTAQVHRGHVWERILETARAEKADLIVMSMRGHDSLFERMIGSNTERVVRHATCPVLVA